MKTEGNIKGILLEFLKFAEYQVENDRWREDDTPMLANGEGVAQRP